MIVRRFSRRCASLCIHHSFVLECLHFLNYGHILFFIQVFKSDGVTMTNRIRILKVDNLHASILYILTLLKRKPMVNDILKTHTVI